MNKTLKVVLCLNIVLFMYALLNYMDAFTKLRQKYALYELKQGRVPSTKTIDMLAKTFVEKPLINSGDSRVVISIGAHDVNNLLRTLASVLLQQHRPHEIAVNVKEGTQLPKCVGDVCQIYPQSGVNKRYPENELAITPTILREGENTTKIIPINSGDLIEGELLRSP